MKFAITALAGAALLAGLAIAPAASFAQSGIKPSADGIVVYNAQHQSLAKEWADAFTTETGIKVTLRNGGDTQLGNQIVQEGAASPADVFLTENSPAMALVEKAKLFAPLPEDVLAEVPAQYRPANGTWIGIAARATVLAYDKTKLKEADLPKSLLDLALPAWKGRWGAAPGGADFHAIVAALLELKGEKETAAWLKAMKENAVPFKSNSIALKAVNDGQVPTAIIYHYYFVGDQAKTGENSRNVALHYFKNGDPGAFVSISGGGVLASSKHKEEAVAFLKWIAGKGGQAVLRTGTSYEYAVGVGAPSNDRLVPLTELGAPKVEPSALDSKKVMELMLAAGIL
ncbi:iron ABC transporter substrate-binding protein [Azorhizobium doebereinerae]|uniref:iron ABC transporter substrate-binding protein n=1 Tax=Azorhizobium doebereinerae TaxID=281091 RepID=UPI000406C4A0|nr:iron ABC transporter substrate-binding protein [Azorhizobium doebereinerae]